MHLRKYIILFTLCFSVFSLKSQEMSDSLSFINYNQNSIENTKCIANSLFLQKIQSPDKIINIVHIGDSHLQAGFLTEEIKQKLFNFLQEKNNASPGFIFPYTIAETNNPFFFKVNFTGNWTYCKNVDQEKTCKLGLSGITLQTTDSIATIKIAMQNSRSNQLTKYSFDKIKILHNQNEQASILVNGLTTQWENGYSIADLKDENDSVVIEITQIKGSVFDLYGIIPEKSNSRLNYHTIGVNGATAQSYLKCDYFSDHLKLLNPDLVIISLGTNEAYAEDFNPLQHEFIFRDLLLQIIDLSHVPILCITANDHQKDRSYHNTNVALVNENIKKVCLEQDLAYWDFYSIMGGENSILDWYNKGLTGEDKLHFKKSGYQIQGDLFVKALIKLIESKSE